MTGGEGKETDGGDARVVREHKPAHTVVRLHVWGAARQGDLDRGRAPGDEVRELPLADAEERLVHLRDIIGVRERRWDA